MGPKRKSICNESLETPKRQKLDDNLNSYTRRSGVINRMILKNFMCHSLLEVDFTANNINFVIGKNGSGKSAILTALIIGLGGKATLTNRGNSVKGFIKVGKTSCSIEIELCNKGPMSYKNKVFGDTITVVRNITSSGGSYRVKSATGEVISTQAKEIHNITTNLNIQVDNPVCLLTQDTSRNFLSSKDPRNKFSLFMKATQLETIESEYTKISTNRTESFRSLSDKKKEYSNLEEEITKLKSKIDGHQMIVNLKEKKLSLQKEMFWAEVKDIENELAQDQQDKDKLVKKMEEFKIKMQSRCQDVEIYKSNIETYETQYESLQRDLETEQEKQSSYTRQVSQLHAALSGKNRQRQDISMQIETKSRDVKNLQIQIAESSENISKVEQQKQQRMRELENMQKKLKEFESHLETARNDLIQVKSDLARKKEDETSLRTELEQIGRKIADENRSLAALRNESGNVLMLYGRNMPRILQLIDQYANRFTRKPVGPLGHYIKLRDKKWAVAVEGYLGQSMLRAFTVDNQRDNKLLREIFGKTIESGQPQPTIITSKFFDKKHDVRKNLVQSPKDCVSLYDVLIIDNPVVANCIVDQRSVESILLVPNNSRAIELMSNKDNVPFNCMQSITIQGDRYYPDPHYKTYASNYHRARFLQVNTEEHALLIEEKISSMTRNQQVMYNQLQALKKEMHIMMEHQNELEEKIRKVNIAKSRIRTMYEDLKDQLEPEAYDIANLEKELREIQDTIATKTAAMESLQEDITGLKTQIAQAEAALTQSKRFSRSLEERCNTVLENIDQNRVKIRQTTTQKKFDEERIKEFQMKVKQADIQLSSKQKDTQKKVKQAEALGERPPEIRAVKEIFNEVQEMSRKIIRIESESDNIEEVANRYQQLIGKYKQVSTTMRQLTSTINALNQAVEKRRKYYKLTENYFVTYMKHSFKSILEIRQFKGMIEIDVANKKLDLVVMPQQGATNAGSTSNLSGGERSFSTVAFLYSLWQCMDFPFYFLDEFDVYMDKLNRTKVIEILLHHAHSKPDLQFVFLTPQDVSFLPKDVAVLKLNDPERKS